MHTKTKTNTEPPQTMGGSLRGVEFFRPKYLDSVRYYNLLRQQYSFLHIQTFHKAQCRS